MDLLEEGYAGGKGNRVLILPVEVTLPRAVPQPAATPEQPATEEKSPERIGREESYEDIKDAARLSRVYMAMVVLSTIVAAVGLYYNSVAIIIGAIVIAPLLGPNMAMSLATALDDLPLLRHALLTALAGIATTMVLSVILGVLLHVNPNPPEIASRNGVALGALSLFLMNLICVNLAGVTTLLVQGIRPAIWWEKDRATKASHIAIPLWVALLAALGGIILLLRMS